MALVRWSPLAWIDLEEIWHHIAIDSVLAASEMIEHIDRAAQDRTMFPLSGKRRPRFGLNMRSFPVKPYMVFYRPIPGGIELARVIHGARDLRKAFRSRM